MSSLMKLLVSRTHRHPHSLPLKDRETNRRARSARGFTLIEILIVVVILGILAGIVVVNVMDRPDQARVVAARNDIAALSNALKLYRLDNGAYPSADQGLQALIRRPESGNIPGNWKPGGYVERLPKDPWGNDYQYLNPGVYGEIDVFSYGADGRPGGESYSADIGSWDTTR
jgi:general secretion pathway protein G